MTPEQAKTLAQPVVDIYAQLTDELMTSIAKQLGKDNTLTDTAEWQLKKMSQLGELNQRNIQTIAKRTSECPDMYYQAVIDAASQAMNDADGLFSAALAAEELQLPVQYPASESMMNRLKILQEQAKSTLNLTNTTMTYKARDAYNGIVNKVAAMADDEEYRKILGKNAASVVTGIQSRQAALRQCLHEFAEKGMPGFVDKAGREWQPESYINMNLRTTVSNVANEAQFARMDDYGNDLIEVSSHIGARPKCEPYQGKIFSRSGKSGYTEDLNGNKIAYSPWGSTSYGDPGGLLGINCGHQIYPFFPGFSRQTYTPYNKEKNDEVYRQSQQQRALERKIRESKRECAMLDAAGDEEGFEKAAVNLKRREAALKHFSQETGRTIKSDRAQVHGYGRSQASKARSSAEDHYQTWIHDIGSKDSAPKTLAKYYDMKYNDPPRYALLKQYAKDVERGWISPSCGFDNYESLYNRVEKEIVGKTTADGILITGQSKHFMQRVVGTMVDPKKYAENHQIIRRSGTEIEDIKDALFSPKTIDKPVTRSDGKRSVRYIGTKGVATVNPDTGELIQTNQAPKRGGKNGRD